MTKEQLEETLTYLSDNNLIENYQSLDRSYTFEVRGTNYKIVWYHNVSSLYINEFKMFFHDLGITTTIPRKFKSFIEFKDSDGKWLAEIPLEKH